MTDNPLRALTRETLVKELENIERLLQCQLDRQMRAEAEGLAMVLRAQLAQLAVIP